MNLSELFSNYYTVRAEMVDAVRNLSQSQFDWRPPNHTHSIGILLAHIAESEYWWISIVAQKKSSPAEADFDRFEKARKPADILALLDEYLTETRTWLERERVEDWDDIFYDVEGRDKKVSKRWLIWHVVEHQARHRGQIFMIMRMQGIDVPNV